MHAFADAYTNSQQLNPHQPASQSATALGTIGDGRCAPAGPPNPRRLLSQSLKQSLKLRAGRPNRPVLQHDGGFSYINLEPKTLNTYKLSTDGDVRLHGLGDLVGFIVVLLGYRCMSTCHENPLPPPSMGGGLWKAWGIGLYRASRCIAKAPSRPKQPNSFELNVRTSLVSAVLGKNTELRAAPPGWGVARRLSSGLTSRCL